MTNYIGFINTLDNIIHIRGTVAHLAACQPLVTMDGGRQARFKEDEQGDQLHFLNEASNAPPVLIASSAWTVPVRRGSDMTVGILFFFL